MKIGIIGNGFVGGATSEIFMNNYNISIYDKFKDPWKDSSVLEESEAIFLCVPTPMNEGGRMDSSYLEESVQLIDKIFESEDRKPFVIIRSTVVPGTTKKLEERFDLPFAFNPEFLREKYALEDMRNTNRIVIGSNDPFIGANVREIYEPLFPEVDYFLMDSTSAEMIKYSANVVLAGQIALANEIYVVCESLGVDYDDVKEVLLADDRIGRNIEVPGPDGLRGFGGKCFPKDLRALISISQDLGYSPDLLEEVWRSNLRFRERKDWEEIPGAVSNNKDF